MNSTTSNGAESSVASILLEGGAAQRISELEHKVLVLQALVQTKDTLISNLRSAAHIKIAALDLLLDHAKNLTSIDDTNKEALWERLVELVSEDDDAVWNVVRYYDVTVTYIVTVTGTVQATSEEAAEALLRDDPPDLRLSDDGALSDADMTYDTDSVQVS